MFRAEAPDAAPLGDVPTGAPRRIRRRVARSPRAGEYAIRTRPGAAYAYVLPSVAIVALVYVYPLVDVLRTSLAAPAGHGASLANFRVALSDGDFRAAIANNARFVLCVPAMLVLGVGVALLLYRQLPGWRLHRALVFLPYVLAVPVVGIAFSKLFAYRGPLNDILLRLGVLSSPRDWLGDPATALVAIGVVIVWRELGFVVVVLLARLMALDRSLLEAARLDGAGNLALLRHVILPQLASTLSFLALIETITVFSWIFGYVYTLTNGGPGNATTIVELYIYQRAFVFAAPSLAAAVAILLLLLVGALVGLQVAARGRLEAQAA